MIGVNVITTYEFSLLVSLRHTHVINIISLNTKHLIVDVYFVQHSPTFRRPAKIYFRRKIMLIYELLEIKFKPRNICSEIWTKSYRCKDGVGLFMHLTRCRKTL